MNIDIDKLSEEELIDLNNRIVARLRFLNQMRAHSQMLDFRIGDRVTFQPDGRPPLFGIITRYNKKTVTVITDGGQHWTVAPGLLRKAAATDSTEPQKSQNRTLSLYRPSLTQRATGCRGLRKFAPDGRCLRPSAPHVHGTQRSPGSGLSSAR
jgi:hypothetical protein